MGAELSVHTYTYVDTYVYANVYINVSIQVYVYANAYLNLYIDVYVYICMCVFLDRAPCSACMGADRCTLILFGYSFSFPEISIVLYFHLTAGCFLKCHQVVMSEGHSNACC